MNPQWLIVAGVVAVVLYLKGYLKVPDALKPKPSVQPASAQAASPTVDLSAHSALDLSIAFAKAVRREAEHEVAFLTASKAATDLKATFMAPFSAPPAPPAGPSPSQPGE